MKFRDLIARKEEPSRGRALGFLGAGMALILGCLSSCTGGNSSGGLPRNLPHIAVNSSSATPPHSMSRGEYPFDSRGNYVTSWAAEGRGATSADSQYQAWKSSHSSPSVTRVSSSSSSRPTTSRSSSSSSSRTSSTKKPTASRSSTIYHTVRSGETLYGLARKYGTTVSKIKSANGLKSDLIRIGQKIKIVR